MCTFGQPRLNLLVRTHPSRLAPNLLKAQRYMWRR